MAMKLKNPRSDLQNANFTYVRKMTKKCFWWFCPIHWGIIDYPRKYRPFFWLYVVRCQSKQFSNQNKSPLIAPHRHITTQTGKLCWYPSIWRGTNTQDKDETCELWIVNELEQCWLNTYFPTKSCNTHTQTQCGGAPCTWGFFLLFLIKPPNLAAQLSVLYTHTIHVCTHVCT